MKLEGERLREKTKEAKKYRRETKKLRRIIAEQQKTDTSDDDDDDDVGTGDVRVDDDTKVIATFQRLASYIKLTRTSLTGICKRQGVAKSKYLDAYIDIRYRRVKLCHPDVEPIRSDMEFLDTILVN